MLYFVDHAADAVVVLVDFRLADTAQAQRSDDTDIAKALSDRTACLLNNNLSHDFPLYDDASSAVFSATRPG